MKTSPHHPEAEEYCFIHNFIYIHSHSNTTIDSMVLISRWFNEQMTRGHQQCMAISTQSLKATRFCTPEFPELAEKYASSAYFFPIPNLALKENIE
jgi:hypothetical protein